MITVHLMNDDPSMQTVLRLRLELEPDITVISDSPHRTNTTAHLIASAPDVVILDVTTPIRDQASAAALLGTYPLDSAVVVLSLYDDPTTMANVRAAGAVAVVSKHSPDELLIDAIRSAATWSSANE